MACDRPLLMHHWQDAVSPASSAGGGLPVLCAVGYLSGLAAAAAGSAVRTQSSAAAAVAVPALTHIERIEHSR